MSEKLTRKTVKKLKRDNRKIARQAMQSESLKLYKKTKTINLILFILLAMSFIFNIVQVFI